MGTKKKWSKKDLEEFRALIITKKNAANIEIEESKKIQFKWKF